LILILLPTALVVILSVLLGAAASSGMLFDKLSVGFCDAEESIYSSVFTNILITDQRYSDFLTIEKLDYETLISRLESGELDAAIILPERFVADMMVGVNRPIEVISNEENLFKAAVIRELMESAAAQITAAQSAINTSWYYTNREGLRQNELNRIFNTLVMNYMSLSFSRDVYFQSRSVSAFGSYRIEHFFMASALSLFIFLSCTACIKKVLQNRDHNIHRRLYSCGKSSFRIAFSDQAPVLLISFTQSLFILAFTAVLATHSPVSAFLNIDGITPHSAFVIVAAAMAVCMFASSAVCLICNLFKNTESAEIFSFSFLIISAITGGTVIPYAYLPEIFERFGAASYSRWSQQFFLNAAFGDFPANLAFLAITSIVSLIFLLASAGIIRKEIRGSIK